MSKNLLNATIAIVCLLLAIFAFGMLYVETGTSNETLYPFKYALGLMEALTGFCIVALIYLARLKTKKAE